MNIYLIGYRCSGKTSVGKALAGILGRLFRDTDREIVSSRGMSIAEIVRMHGWETFREWESECLARTASEDNVVVATGGGIVLAESNIEQMKATGRIVWLRVRPETVVRRMAQDPVTGEQRPALTDGGAMAEIESVLVERDPIYTRVMEVAVDTDDRSVEEICTELRKWAGKAE